MRLGKNLERLRKQRSLKQKDLASKLGVKPSRYSRWESGSVFPSIDIIIACAKFYGVSLDDLCGYTLKPDKRRSDVEVAVDRLREMGIDFATEYDNVHLDIYGTKYIVHLKDLQAVISKTDKYYDSMLRDIKTGLYNSAIALALNKSLYKKYLEVGQIRDKHVISNNLLRRLTIWKSENRGTLMTPGILIDILKDFLVLLPASEREEAWDYVVQKLPAFDLLDEETYEKNRENWQCPVLIV